MSFEEAFFGPGNRLRWKEICAGTISTDVKSRLGPFLDNLARAPDLLVLPRVREDDGRVQWYVLCASERIARVARDELRAFLGPSYSDFEGRPTILDASDPVEAAVLSKCGTGNRAFRIEVPERSFFTVARERLLMLTRLRDERPARTPRHPRAVGRVLRDFEYGLMAADGEATVGCILELRTAGQLSATNLLFLEVRRLAALRQWNAILALPEFGALLTMPRPRRVTEALIQATYAVRLREFEEGERASEALARFRAEVVPHYSELFRAHAGLSGYEVDASFLLASAASEPPRRELAQAILQRHTPGTAGRSYLAALAALVPPPAPQPIPSRDPLSEAQEAFALADVDRAYNIASRLAPSFEACALLLRCARDMGTLEAAREALASVDTLPDRQHRQVAEHAVLGRFLVALRTLVAPRPVPAAPTRPLIDIPDSWPAWLERLAGDEPWRSAVTVAEAAAREWDVDALASDGDAIARTAELIISNRPPWGQAALRDSLPHLIEFFLSRGADARLKPIYEHLFLSIATDDQISLPQIATLLRVAEARLQLGLPAAEYSETVHQLIASLEAAESPSVVDVALDALDVLAGEVCPDTGQRQEFVARVAAIFHRWYRRIDTSQWALLRRLADELRVPEAVGNPPAQENAPAAASIWNALDRKRVSLYSLREPVLRRVHATLLEICPDIHVQCFSDHVGGSQALRAASMTADIFVIATAAAKHAATQYIEVNRPKSQVTLYARGQGSSSLLDAIRDFLHRTGSARTLDQL
jgi:hypothetical protein